MKKKFHKKILLIIIMLFSFPILWAGKCNLDSHIQSIQTTPENFLEDDEDLKEFLDVENLEEIDNMTIEIGGEVIEGSTPTPQPQPTTEVSKPEITQTQTQESSIETKETIWNQTLEDIPPIDAENTEILESEKNKEQGVNSVILNNVDEESFITYRQKLLDENWKIELEFGPNPDGSYLVSFSKAEFILKITWNPENNQLTIHKHSPPTVLVLPKNKKWEDLVVENAPPPPSGRITSSQEVKNDDQVIAQRVVISQILNDSMEKWIEEYNANENLTEAEAVPFDNLLANKCGPGMKPSTEIAKELGIATTEQKYWFELADSSTIIEIFFAENTAIFTTLLP